MSNKTEPLKPITDAPTPSVFSPQSSPASAPAPQNAGSTDPANLQSAIPNPKSRQDALDEASKIIGQDMVNSCESVAHLLRAGQLAAARDAFTLLLQRADKAHALLQDQLENLPEL